MAKILSESWEIRELIYINRGNETGAATENNLPEDHNDYKEKTCDLYTIDAEGSPADGVL
jgi:hypothetical protein